METAIRTRRFGLGDLLSVGWKLYRIGFAQILPILLCVYIPLNVILVMVTEDPLFENAGLRGFRAVSNILEFLLGSVATIAIAYIVENGIQGQSVVWHKALRHGLSRWLSAIFTGWLAGLIILGLTFLLIVPGIIWSLYYTFYLYVVALRNTDGKKALDYSKNLVKGQWWRVFGISLAIGLLGLLVGTVIGITLGLLPTSTGLDVVTYTIMDIIGALFTMTLIVFFLNIDYLKHPIAAAPIAEQKTLISESLSPSPSP